MLTNARWNHIKLVTRLQPLHRPLDKQDIENIARYTGFTYGQTKAALYWGVFNKVWYLRLMQNPSFCLDPVARHKALILYQRHMVHDALLELSPLPPRIKILPPLPKVKKKPKLPPALFTTPHTRKEKVQLSRYKF